MQRTSTPNNGHPATAGFVLVVTLLTMIILMVIATALLFNSTGAVQQSNGYSGVSRARAVAEAGLVRAQYAMTEQVLPTVQTILQPYTTSFKTNNYNAATTAIVPISAYNTVLASLNTITAASPSGTLDTDGSTGSFGTTTVFSNFRADAGTFNSAGQTYYVDYLTTSTGTVGTYKRVVKAQGTLNIRMGGVFVSQYLMLADDGGGFNNGNPYNFFGNGMIYDGPVHFNKNWLIWGSPKFTMGATTAESAIYWNDASQSLNATNAQKRTVQAWGSSKPDWGTGGLQYSQPAATLPKNAYSQQNAALGLDATSATVPSLATICTQLSLAPCPAAIPAGTYLPANGGIYIQGDAQISMSVGTNDSQIYKVVTGTTTTTITVDYTNNVTCRQVGTGPVTCTAPARTGNLPGASGNGQVFVNGSITALTGPARTGALPSNPTNSPVPAVIPPAVSRKSQLNISATTNIDITGDITYQDDPRNVTGAKNVIAYTAGTGNVQIGAAAPNDVYVHGSVLAGANGKGFAVVNYNKRAVSGQIHLLGSMAESVDPPRGVGNSTTFLYGYGDDFSYDKRLLNGSVAPPFFPTTGAFAASVTWPTQRTWQEDSQ